jgi:hypothetical protein
MQWSSYPINCLAKRSLPRLSDIATNDGHGGDES